MGRPTLPDNERRSSIHLLLHPATLRQLEEYCRDTGLSKTSVIEDALIIHLAKNSRPAMAVYGGEEEDRYAD